MQSTPNSPSDREFGVFLGGESVADFLFPHNRKACDAAFDMLAETGKAAIGSLAQTSAGGKAQGRFTGETAEAAECHRHEMVRLSKREPKNDTESTARNDEHLRGRTMYRRFGKRLIDTIISTITLIVLSPLMLLTAVAVKLESKGPAIFKQRRLGLHGKEFDIYKFRSMVQNAEHTGSGVYSGKDDARVTKVGRVIRATSIDELPQAVNILKGDMSLIGESVILGATRKNLDFPMVCGC